MSDTRSSSLIKKSDLPKEEQTMDNPKALLANFVQINETVAASQPDDSPTVTHIKQKIKRRSSRRSSGIRALNQTPHGLLENFIENAPEETTLKVNTSLESSDGSDDYLIPVHEKISKVVDDDQTDSSVEAEEIVRKMPRSRYKAVLEKFSVGPNKQSESPDEDLGSEMHQKPHRIKKIRNKITAEDIALGVKLSQEMATETEKSYNVIQATKTDASLFFPSINTLNTENLDNTTMMSSEKTDSSDRVEEKEDSHGSQRSKYSKRKQSFMKDETSKVEESFRKSKMLRLKTNMDKVVSAEDARSSEVESTELPNLVSEAELTEVAYTVEVAESKEMDESEQVAENVQDDAGNEKNESQENEEKIVIKSPTNVKQETEESEKSALSMFNEINKMLQDESINMEKATNDEESEKITKHNLGKIKRIKRAVENSSEQASLTSTQLVSKTSEMLPPGIHQKMTKESKVSQSKFINIFEDFEALSKSSRDNKSNVSKGLSSNLHERANSSYLESSNRTFESNINVAKERPLLDSKARETLASSRKSQMSSHISLDMPEIGAHSVEKVNLSAISHETSTVAFQTEMSGQSDEVAKKVEESIKSQAEVKERPKELAAPLVAGNLSTDDHDELFPSSPKETTSSGHSRSSSPASSEADKATQSLKLPSSKSAFVEMKSSRSNVLPSSTVLTKRTSSKRKSSSKMKSLEKMESKSYRMIDSVASPTESLPSIENVTKDLQILSRNPLHTTISAQQTTEKPVTPKKPQGDTSQNEKKVKKHTVRSLKKYTIPPKVTSLLMNHYSGLKIPNACLPELGKISDHFIDNLFEALHSYMKHASHKRIEDSDVELYFRRVGLVNKDKSLHTLIREFLPLEDQQLLIPVARSGNIITGGFSNTEKQKTKRN